MDGVCCHQPAEFASLSLEAHIDQDDATILIAVPLSAQEKLSMREALQLALQGNKSLVASGAAVKATSLRIQEARAGMLPTIDYSESLTRSNNPVFVFSSLLEQRQFAHSNFQADSLNRPSFLNNFQSSLVLSQTLFDGGQAHKAVRSAKLARDLSSQPDFHSRHEGRQQA